MSETKTTLECRIRGLRWCNEDMQQLLEIERLSFNEFDAYTLQDFKRWFTYNPDLCLVGEVQGKIAGYVMTRIIPVHADLASMAVHPAYKRKGIASALLKETEARVLAYGVSAITLEVRRTNAAGMAFWGSMGFTPFGIQPGFYEDGEEAILMRKEIRGVSFRIETDPILRG